ncbi:unnamed protein product [Ixodes hexagonus]
MEAARYTELERRMEQQDKEHTVSEEEEVRDNAPDAKGDSVVLPAASQEQSQEVQGQENGVRAAVDTGVGDSWDEAGSKKLGKKERRRHRREELKRECAATEPLVQGMKKATPTMRPPKGVLREVIVAGDGNVGRFAEVLVQNVGIPDSVEFLYRKGATVEQAHEAITEYEDQARDVPRTYVLNL